MQRLVGHFIAFLQGNPNLQQKRFYGIFKTENVLFDFATAGIVYSEEKSCNLFNLGLYRKFPARTLRLKRSQEIFERATSWVVFRH
ncbi:MAG TPA: hypothetical protein VMX36_14680 [Sedimentisphaerales bacterium]|nr:hypothetical protein [Sedimentisphaerales bacterium]